MKNTSNWAALTFLFFIINSFLVFSQSGWIQQESGTAENLNAIFFKDINNGFVVGNNGTLLRTNDGGTTWTLQSLGTSTNLKSVSFLDSINGYIFGPEKTFYKTTDGGNSWLNLSNSINYSFEAMSFLDPQNGIAIQSTSYDTAKVYRTTDGGLSWNYLSKVISNNYYIRLLDICYLDENNIVAAGFAAFSAVIYQSTDGGLTWFFRTYGGGSSSGIGYDDIQFSNSTTGFLLANGGMSSCYKAYIYKTLNGGTSWAQVDNGTLPECRSIFMLDEYNGYAVGDKAICMAGPGAIYRTNSGGIYWEKQFSNTAEILNDVYFIDSNTGIVIGDHGVIFKTTNSGETEINSKPIYPANNSTGLFLPIEFKWSSVPNIISYGLQVSTDISFNQPLLSLTNLTDTSYTHNLLNHATQYYWRVKTELSSDHENWSLAWEFTTIDYQYNLSAPENNSTELMFPIEFKWSNVQNALSYELQISTNSSFNASTQSFTNLSDTTYKVISLKNDTQYYWRVKTVFSSGYENWSPVWKFTTTDYPDILLAPKKNSINIPTTVKLLWKKSTNAISYLVQVSLDPTFTDSSFTYDVEDTMKVLENLKSYRKYFWKVQPTLLDGNEGWSEIWSFTTMQLPLTFKLYQNHPNPFNPSTKISWQAPLSGWQTIKVFDVLGKEVKTLVDEYRNAGSYEVEFIANNLPSGVYFYQLKVGDYLETKKMTFLK